MGVFDKPIRRLPSHPHPPKLKEVRKVLPQVIGVPVHLPSFRPSHGPTGPHNDCKGSQADGHDKGNQTSPIPGQLAYQGPVSERSTSEHSDSGRSESVSILHKVQTFTGYSPVFTGIIQKVPGIFQNETFLLFSMSSQKHPLSL